MGFYICLVIPFVDLVGHKCVDTDTLTEQIVANDFSKPGFTADLLLCAVAYLYAASLGKSRSSSAAL